MISVQQVIRPATVDDAFEALQKNRFATLLGGGGFLRMGSKNITTLIDLSDCGLDRVKEQEDHWEIGAMVTLGELERHQELNHQYDGLLAAAVEEIVGVALRNVVTVGASVYARYGFSDVITGLLALPVKLRLYQGKEVTLEHFLQNGAEEKDILEAILIEKGGCQAGFASLRKTSGDYAVLNTAAAITGGRLRISVGARPGRASLAHKAMASLQGEVENVGDVQKAAVMASEELNFGTNRRGSKEYRKQLCQSLVARVLRDCMAGGGQR